MLKLMKWFFLGSVFVLLIAIVLLWLAHEFGYPLQTHVLTPLFGDPIDRMARRLAGREAINCGRVGWHGDPNEATRCSLEAQAKGLPFRVVYRIPGVDSIIADAFVHTPDGRLIRIVYDSCPQGCGFSIWFQRIYYAPCEQPQRLGVDSHGRLTCPFAAPFDPRRVKHGPLLIFY
jgi:hypothetical protein